VKRNLSIFVFLLASLALWASIRETGDAPGNWIRLEMPDFKSSISWQRTGDRFVSKQSKVVLSLDRVAQMRLDIRHTSRGRQHFAQEVGLTPEALRSHRDVILKSCYIEKLPAELEHHLDYQSVLKNAQALAFLDEPELVGQGATLIIDGRPELRVKARSTTFSFLLPATVDCAGEHWETCSLAVTDAITSLFEPDSQRFWSNMSARTFWSADIWVNNEGALDHSIWAGLAADHRTFCDLPGFCKRPGYEQLSQRFRIVSLWDFHDGFYVTLATHQPEAIDLVDWSNKQNASLASILPTYQNCDANIRGSHRWLLTWKNCRSDRVIELKVEKTESYNPIFTQWRKAGLPGRPEFELELLDHDRHCATVWLSSRSPDSLIPWATDKWQSGMAVNNPRETGQVIVVDPSGKLERKSIGEPPP